MSAASDQNEQSLKRQRVDGDESHLIQGSTSTEASSDKKKAPVSKAKYTFPPLLEEKRLVMLVLEYDGTHFKGWQSQLSSTAGDTLPSDPEQEPIYIPGVKKRPGEALRTVRTQHRATSRALF